MPPYSNLQLLKLQYREFLRKTSTYHRSEGGDACAHTYYVERAWSEASFEDSFTKLSQVVSTFEFSELRACYQARKERAKERLRRAFDAKVLRLGKYLGKGEQSKMAASNDASFGSLREASLHAVPPDDFATNQLRASEVSSSGRGNADLQMLYGEDGILRRMVLCVLGSAARSYMTSLNTTRVEGAELMASALRRPVGQALITVSNHVAALDDPLVVSALLPEGALQQPGSIRWTLCATDRCFRYPALVPLFRAAKVLPVVRGGGLAQPGMVAAEERLAAGDWVHIFPEGTRSADGVTLGSVRKGVGRLVAAMPPDGPPPLVVPFVHRGMENVMPRGAVLPAVGQQIDILVGEPIPVVDLLAAARNEGWPADRLHTAVAARVAHGLKDLRHRLDARSAGLPDPGPSAPEPPSTASSVSSLDQFDPTDLTLAAELRAARRWGGGGSVSGGVSGTWERLKSRMALQHRTWATQSMPAVSASVAASAGGALAARPSGTAGAMSPPLRGAIAATCGSVVMAPDCAERLTAGGLGLGAGGWSLPPLREFLGMGMGPRWCPEAAVSGRSSASGHWSGGLSAGRSIEAVIMA